MSNLIYVSRSFVEFGPFKSEEIQDFRSRGILTSLDFLRSHGEDEWTHVEEWFSRLTSTSPEPEAPVAEKPKKKAPAKKAAKKSPKKTEAA